RVAEGATRRRPNHAVPGARDVVVRSANDPVRVVWVNCNCCLVLGRCGCILVHSYSRGSDGRAIERTREYVRWRDRGIERPWRGTRFLCFLLNERREADRQTLRSVYRCDLAGKGVDVVNRPRLRNRTRRPHCDERRCHGCDEEYAPTRDAQMRDETISKTKPVIRFHNVL